MTAMHQQQQLHRQLPPPQQQQQTPNGQFHYRQQQLPAAGGGSQIPVDSFSSSSGGSSSPSLSLRTATAEDSLSTLGYPRMVAADCESASGTPAAINLQIFVPELQMQKCLSVPLDELVWDIKRRLLESLPQQLPQHFNFGLFLPPCDGRAGKFLLEDRPIRDYPFHDCVPYVELKYKKRVYKMLRLDEKALRSVHSKANLRKFAEAVQQKNAQKVERLCTQGLDPNFHDPHGETPLTLASGIPGNRQVLVQLVGGGAHLDFRNTEGQTGMHKAAFLSLADNVRALLELGASPNYRDLIGLTPLYYAMLTPESSPEVAEMLLAEAADLDIVDMHGNTALHQACKNGLAKQAELLLYYGADQNARNVNGNSPLHVCAVNGRVDCAQVLLYRGADPTLLNRQGQTAVAVAQIVGLVGMPVADVIKGHSPHNIVPFREAPKLNPRRRLSSRQFSVGGGLDGTLRRRSLSHCSSSSTIASSQQQQQQHRMSANAYGQQAISPSPSMASSATDYGTLRRIPAEAVQHQQPGLELNVPRILVIPRGPKGFGFILRGARHVDSMQMDFRPSATAPALQFFEGVDMQGMAMRAGLRPGDFLLEINGVDVRAASHEQVVQLIHQSGDTITLKVITVDLELLAREQGQQQQPQIYATTAGASTGNYATLGRRNHSVPRTAALNNGGPITTNGNGNGQSGMPPQPPQRNPSTTLSFGRAFTTNGGAAQFSTADISPVSASSSSSPMHQQPPPLSTTPSMAKPNPTTTATTSAEHNHPLHPSSYPIPPPFPVSSAAQSHQQQQQQIRCASVKVNRTSAVRRISAAELEHLMVQQGSSSSQQQQSIVLGPEQPNGGGGGGAPRKFTSVTEMKRRKQNLRANSVSVGADEPNGLYGSPLKNCNSTPDLLQQQGQSEFRPVLRPKTPPPPPPPVGIQKQAAEPAEPELQPIYASTVCVVPAEPQTMAPASGPTTSSSSATCGPPAPPPPPPPDFLLRPSQPSPASSTLNQQPQLRTTEQQQKAGNAESTAAGADCRGISADALRSVRLKPVASKAADEQPKRPALKTTAATSGARNGGKDNEKPKIPMPADFDSDLRSALAKRRIKVRGGEDGSGGESSTEDAATASVQQTVQSKAVVSIAVGGGGQARKAAEPQQSTAAAASQPGGSSSVLAGSRYTGGLSLRESVLENVSGVAGKAGGGGHGCVHKTAANSHSPPGGFIGTKKDSGYTSSRTSLEPSECGDCCEHHLLPTAGGTQAASLPVQHRVNVISQQLMDQQQTPLVGRLSPKQAPRFLEHQPTALVRIPPVDYEEHSEGGTSSIDSGNLTDLDQQTTAGGSSSQASVEESEFADGQQQSGSQTPSANSSPSAAANDGFHNLEPHQGRGRPSSQFRQRPISDWAPEDVSDWLRELELGEHCQAFATVRGTDLLRFDRARYTALGVTRIGHRQKMEQSLRAMQRE